MPDTRSGELRTQASWLLMAMPLLVMVSEVAVGLVALVWLLFCAVAWRGATKIVPARASLDNMAVVGFFAFPALAVLLLVAFGGNWAVADNPSRFLLVLPVIVVVAGLSPSPMPFFGAQAVAGCYVGIFALIQVFVQGIVPAGGITNPNKFGYIGATYTLLCLAACRLRPEVRPAWWLLMAGCAMGMVAMLLSGTRGTWIAFAISLSCWFLLSRSLRVRLRVLIVSGLAIGVAVFAWIEGTVVQQRWLRTGAEIAAYRTGHWENSSIGERFELWRAALFMIQEHPWTGVGLGNYPKFLSDLVARGLINPQVAHHGHAHNEYLNWFATGGIGGLIGVVAVLLLPLLYFLREARQASLLSRDLAGAATVKGLDVYRTSALAGSLFVLCTSVFCFFDAFFYIHFAALYYAFTVAVLIGFVESSRP